MSRNSSTYFYLAIVVGLLCFLAIDKKHPGTKEREDDETRLFPPIENSDVTGLEISNSHGVYIFQKNGNHWEIKSPVNTLADGPAVEEVLSQIEYAQPQRVIEVDGDSAKDQANLKDWGLAPAVGRVVIHLKGGVMRELMVGRKVAINDSIYARASGRKNEPVRVLPSTIKTVVEKDLTDFRSRSVFDFDTDKVTKISSHVVNIGTTPPQECEVDLKDAKWTLQKPLVARASTADVQGLLNKILAARVTAFITDDASNLTQYGLTSPSASLTVTLPDDEMMLQVGGPVPNKPDQVYAQRLKSNSVFTLAKATVDDLLHAVPDVRDRHVLPFDPAKATGLSLTFGTRKIQLHYDGKDWLTVGDSAGKADMARVNDLLAKISQLETTPVLKDSATDLKPFGLDKPQGKIVVQSPEFKPESGMTLLIGKAENKLLYVRNSTEPFIYSITDSSFDSLPVSNLALRDLQVINLPLADIKSLSVTAPPAPAVELDRSTGGTWTAPTIKDRMVDSTKADTQAALFAQLQAQAWIGPVLPAYALDKPVLTLTARTNRSKPTILRIGAALPDGGHYAQVEGEPVVFAISNADFTELNSSSLQEIPLPAPTATHGPASNVVATPASVKK